MYTLYFVPGACSLATQVVLRELEQPVSLVHKARAEDFTAINPVGTVPVLASGDQVYTEGAAIMWYLLNRHPSSLLPQGEPARQQALTDIMFANATLHPAYGRLFFLSQNAKDDEQGAALMEAAAREVSRLWRIVETRLQSSPYLSGEDVSAADIMLAVYSRWGQFFSVDIEIGPKSRQMIERVLERPSFVASLAAEQACSQEGP